MNIEQTATVIQKIALSDGRTIDELVILEWHESIGELNFDDAIEAVREHRKTSDRRIQPVHVIEGAREAARRRIEALGTCQLCGDHLTPDRKRATLCVPCRDGESPELRRIGDTVLTPGRIGGPDGMTPNEHRALADARAEHIQRRDREYSRNSAWEAARQFEKAGGAA